MDNNEINIKTGLNTNEVRDRVNKGFVNYNNQPQTKTVKQIVKDNFFTYFNFLNIVLGGLIIFAGLFSGQLLTSLKNCLFMGVIICNSIISIIQEIVSKKTIDKLSVLASVKASVIRNGVISEINIDEIVMDDIISYKIGNQVVVDSIICDGEVEVNEAFITGEQDPIYKKVGDHLLSGSFIVSGSSIGRVINVGKDNYISKISSEAKYVKEINSVILNTFTKLLKTISVIIIPLGMLLMFIQYRITGSIVDSIFATVAALIGMIPEGLVLLTSSVMAVSIVRLSKYNVLVQQLYCIETLARVDVICLDKTGTITEGTMNLEKVVPFKNTKINDIEEVLSNFCGCLEDKSPTMVAIKDKYFKSDCDALEVLPFSSARKFSAVNLSDGYSYYLGAPEFLLEKKVLEKIKEVEEYESEYRTLVLAKTKDKISKKPSDLEIMGFLLIDDVIRKNATETLEFFKKQGVTLKLISGDNYLTVSNIAKKVGFDNPKGVDMTTISDDEIKNIVENFDIYGRVTPHQKQKIIKELKALGHTVAMVGDGVNDVLALKESDCSVALASGSDATKNVSQIVLLDSNFGSMPYVVGEGRRTINNIERSASLLLVKTIYTCLLIILCLFLSEKYFFVPIQLTLITFFTIGFPSFILALEPNNKRLKGNFFVNILRNSIPVSLTVVINICIVMLFKYAFAIDEATLSTCSVLLTAATGFIYLLQICRPFNYLRGFLYFGLLFGFSYAVFFLPDFFNISQFDIKIITIFGILMFCSVYMYDLLKRATKWIFAKLGY